VTPDRWVILTIRLAAADDGTVTASDTVSGCSATARSTAGHGEAAAIALYLLAHKIEACYGELAEALALYPHDQRRLGRLERFYQEVSP
jgi:hypothetical protein